MPSHPFFDAPTYPWHRPEADPFHAAVADTLGVKDVKVIFPKFGGDLKRLNQNQPPNDVWRDVLTELTAVRGLRGLCEWCRDEPKYQKNDPFVAAARAVLAAAFEPPRQVLGDDAELLMFDRQALWTDLDRLRTTAVKTRMLLLGGDHQSGKSHLRNLFEVAARERRAEVVYLTKDLATNVEEVVDALASRIGAVIDIPDLRPPAAAAATPNTTVPAWYKAAINKMLHAARESQTEWWIVMDDLGHDRQGAPHVDETVRLFFKQFGQTFVDPTFSKWFRLMLIGLPAEGRPKWDRDTFVDRPVSAADVTPQHVAEAIQEEAARRKKNLTPAAASELAATVFAAAQTDYEAGLAAAARTPGADPPAWLQCLHDAAVTALKEL